MQRGARCLQTASLWKRSLEKKQLGAFTRFSSQAASTEAPEMTAEQALAKVLEHAYGVTLQTDERGLRSLLAAEPFEQGEQVIQELPLAVSVAPALMGHVCMSCLNPLASPQADTPPLDSSQGVSFDALRSLTCSTECHTTAVAHGAEEWWSAIGPLHRLASTSHPAAARHMLAVGYMLARSWKQDPDTYWAHVEQLAAVSADEGVWSPGALGCFQAEYAALRAGFEPYIARRTPDKQAVQQLFDHTYNLEWYVGMRGLLRLNAVALPATALASPPPPIAPLAHVQPGSTAGHVQSAVEEVSKQVGVAAQVIPFGSEDSVPASELGAAAQGGSDCDVIGTGVFLASSMPNHACEPNLRMSVSLGPVVTLTAVRDIAQGEELTLDYSGGRLAGDSGKRCDVLADTYGFLCTEQGCAQCRSSER